MTNVFRGALAVGAFVLCAVGGLTATKADVLRIAIVVADSQADYTANAATLATAEALLKKATGNKAAYAGTDAAKMSITTSSVFGTAAEATAATTSAEWKEMAGKLKAKSYVVEVFDLVP